MSQSLWVAKLLISQATRAKLSSKHNIDANDVIDAIVCNAGLRYRWDDDPKRGRRALAETYIEGVRVIAVLYPVDDSSGDVYALGSAYPLG